MGWLSSTSWCAAWCLSPAEAFSGHFGSMHRGKSPRAQIGAAGLKQRRAARPEQPWRRRPELRKRLSARGPHRVRPEHTRTGAGAVEHPWDRIRATVWLPPGCLQVIKMTGSFAYLGRIPTQPNMPVEFKVRLDDWPVAQIRSSTFVLGVGEVCWQLDGCGTRAAPLSEEVVGVGPVGFGPVPPTFASSQDPIKLCVLVGLDATRLGVEG